MQNRRFAALEAGDNVEFAKIYYLTEPRKMKIAVTIEETIFDYFGIIAMQYEFSSTKLNTDMDYQVQKLKQQNELARDFVEKEEPEQELTPEKAAEMGKRISGFTVKLMQELQQTDPKSGKKVLNLEDKSFDILLQKEKDQFYLDTGYSTEYVSKVLREQREKSVAAK